MTLTAFYKLKENKKQNFTKVIIYDPICGYVKNLVIDSLKSEKYFYHTLINELTKEMNYKNFDFKFFNITG